MEFSKGEVIFAILGGLALLLMVAAISFAVVTAALSIENSPWQKWMDNSCEQIGG
jgi:hypothetical protein